VTRKFAIAAIAALMCASAALAADDTQNPAQGGDTSTGAKEQSSAPPESKAEKDMSSGSTAGTSSDTSSGAKEQSSSPPGSAAAGDLSKSTDKASCDKAGGMWDQTASKCSEKKM
jgi:opacity protein-like surface antigen